MILSVNSAIILTVNGSRGVFLLAKKAFHNLFKFAIFILVCLVCIYLFLHSSFFNIEKLYTTGTKQITEAEVLAYTSIKEGQNIFEVDSKLSTQTIQVHPLVKNVQIIRHLPRTLEIKIEERQIWAIIPHNEEFLCIDDEGIVIDKKSKVDFANSIFINFLKLPERVNLGQAIEPAGVALIKEVWDSLNKLNQGLISDFHYNEKKELIIYTVNGTEIRFGNNERLEEKLAFMDEVLKIEQDFIKSGEDVLEYIDLRFKGQPIVKTKD